MVETKPENHIEESMLRRIPREILGLALLLALGSLMLFDALTALLILAGGATAALGFVWLKQSVTKFLSSDRRHAVRSAVALYGLRLILIIAVFFIIILFFSKKVFAFIAGFSVIILVFLMEAAAALAKLKQWKS